MGELQPLLRVEHLSVEFKKFKALTDVNLTVNKGEVWVVIGPNGAGKSTLMDLICGRTKPTSGKVFFDGVDITGKEPYDISAKYGIGRKFQNPNIFNMLTVYENIEVALRGFNTVFKALAFRRTAEVKEKIDRVLEMIKLSEKRNIIASSLSHGERQWLEIGMVIAQDPKLENKNITKMPAYMHNQMGIGYVPQGREIIPDFTVRENLELGCLGHNSVSFKEQFEIVLDYFPALKEHMNRKGGVLSGGQQQQLAIGRCLMGRPSIVVLDEPTEGIQPNVVSEIATTLNRISREMYLSVILVEQNIKFAKRIAEDFIILQKGSIVAQGAIGELNDDLAKKYLAV